MQSKGNSEKWQALNFKINRVKSVRQHVRDEPPYLFFLIYYIYIIITVYILYTLYIHSTPPRESLPTAQGSRW